MTKEDGDGYRCPKCKADDKLLVVSCTLYGRMPLRDDGFMLEGDTEDAVVRCESCDYEGPLDGFFYHKKEECRLCLDEDDPKPNEACHNYVARIAGECEGEYE